MGDAQTGAIAQLSGRRRAIPGAEAETASRRTTKRAADDVSVIVEKQSKSSETAIIEPLSTKMLFLKEPSDVARRQIEFNYQSFAT